MATIAKPKQGIPVSFYPLALLTLIGVGLTVYRLVVGLGPTTHLSDHYPWGIWITVDLFLIPVAGAAFTISLLSYFFGHAHCHAIVRGAVLAGLLGYSVAGILLFLDIGRWHQIYNIFRLDIINIHSFLEEVSLCVALYTLILVMEFAPTLLERWKDKPGIQAILRFLNRSIFAVAGVGIVLSTLHQSSLGGLFLIMPYKLHPLWWTPALPTVFFLQALLAGLATTAVAVDLTLRGLNLSIDRRLYLHIGDILRVILAIYLALRVGDWFGAREIGLLFVPDRFSFLMWLELVLGVFVPLGILFTRLKAHISGPFWAGVFILIGIFIDKLVVTWVGLAEPSPVTYFPSLIEIMISVGIAAGAFLLYGTVVRYLDVFPHNKHA
jgi:Ni/Fe-hydrogenase subunit HybB-like protein